MGFFSSSHTSSSFRVWKCILLLKQSQVLKRFFFIICLPYTYSGFNGRKLTATISVLTALIPTEAHNENSIPNSMEKWTHTKKKIFRGNIWIDPQPCTSGSVLLIFEMESKAEKPFRKISNPTTTTTIPDGQCPIKIDVSAMLFAFWMFGGKRKNNSRF